MAGVSHCLTQRDTLDAQPGLLILMALDAVPGSAPSGNCILAVLGLGVSLAD